MRIPTLLFIGFLISSCYKNIDNTVIEEVVRPPKVFVDTKIFGTYTSTDNGVAATAMNINGITYPVINGKIDITEVDNVDKNGQLIEFFDSNRRLGAVQVPLLENQINYLQCKNLPTFTSTDFDQKIRLSNDIQIAVKEGQFVTSTTENPDQPLYAVHSVSSDSIYNAQLCSYLFDKKGLFSTPIFHTSFFIGFENEHHNELKLKNGSIEIYVGSSNDHLFYYSKDEKVWTWISDLKEGVNIERIDKTGYFAVGTSKQANLLFGSVKVNEIDVANITLQIQTEDRQKEIYTSSEGNFYTLISKEEEYDLTIKSLNDQILYSKKIVGSEHNELKIELSDDQAKSNFFKTDFHIIDCEGKLNAFKAFQINTAAQSSSFALNNSDVKYIPVENSQFSIRAGDGPELEWSNSDNKLYYLTDCVHLQEGFSFMKVRNDSKIYPAFTEMSDNEVTTFTAESDTWKFIIETVNIGQITGDRVNLKIEDQQFGSEGYKMACENAAQGCGIDLCEITHLKSSGDLWNRIYFNGTLWMQTINPAKSGNFPVEGLILTKK